MMTGMLKNLIKKTLFLLFTKSLPPPSKKERELISELQAAFNDYPAHSTTSNQPSIATWLTKENTLRELVLSRDSRSFLCWDIINENMFLWFSRHALSWLKYLKRQPDWDTRWKNAIIESPAGNPLPYLLYPKSSSNLIHHAYHISQFEGKTKIDIGDREFIFEFGGGYGSMCRLIHKLGFKGRYVIFDLPLFSALQKYYLKSLELPVKTRSEFVNSQGGISCLSDIQELEALLAHHELPRNTMFIATWSMSEVPIEFRDLITHLISGFDSFLITYQDQFKEINNLEYFSHWKETIGMSNVYHWQMKHIPISYYLVGSA
jgi:hypothetical protein